MTADRQPCSSISASSCCTSGASGVVRDASRSTRPTRYETVPITPALRPAASSTDASR